MTGRELLIELQRMDVNELQYTVLIGLPERWVKLVSIKKDFSMKSLDLQGDEQ